jgi:hypothetical protein
MKNLKEFLKREIKEESPPETDEKGFISPEELHKHLDIQNRGKVDMGDYAAHVMFHCNNPHYLAPYFDKLNPVQSRHAMGEEIRHDDNVMHTMKRNSALNVHSGNEGIYEATGQASYNKPKDPPAILIMRRKSIRMFPNGQRVALYYIDKINKYVTVPYSDEDWDNMSNIRIESAIETVEEVLKTKKEMVLEHLDGSQSEITPDIANKLMSLYRKVNEANKEKMIGMLEASAEQFKQVVNFYKKT